MKTFKCPMCHEEHEIDKYGWIQCNTLGYIELGSFIYVMEKHLEERLKSLGKSINTKGNTKNAK